MKARTPASATALIFPRLRVPAPPYRPKSTSDFFSQVSAFIFTVSGSTTVGTEFGMSTTMVIPPDAAARLPLSKSSL